MQGRGTIVGVGNDTFSNNDGSERQVGFRKHVRQMKPNISQRSNGIEAIAKQNNVFDTFDGICEKDPDEFVRLLVIWHNLSTYRDKELEIKAHKKRINKKRVQTNIDEINECKKRPISISKKKDNTNTKEIIKSKPKLNDTIWISWLERKQNINNLHQFHSKNKWKKQLKQKLIDTLNEHYRNAWKPAMKSWGIDKLQTYLYTLCKTDRSCSK